jgi:hypothetical protein
MRSQRLPRLAALLVAGLLVVMLAGCQQTCPSCASLQQPQPTQPQLLSLDYELCVSKVPEPLVGQDGCANISVTYVLIYD